GRAAHGDGDGRWRQGGRRRGQRDLRRRHGGRERGGRGRGRRRRALRRRRGRRARRRGRGLGGGRLLGDLGGGEVRSGRLPARDPLVVVAPGGQHGDDTDEDEQTGHGQPHQERTAGSRCVVGPTGGGRHGCGHRGDLGRGRLAGVR